MRLKIEVLPQCQRALTVSQLRDKTLLRGVRQLWGGGETVFHSFLLRFLGQFIEGVGYSSGAA